jgi:tetratricopeptide (TPR) repeat protein
MWYFVNPLPLALDIPAIQYVSQSIALVVTPTDIAATTKAAMVSIDSLNSMCSSGLIIHRKNDVYTVLVQQDFLEDGSNERYYGITTSDGLKHPFLPSSRRLESQTNKLGDGLGIVKFRSSVSYQTVKITTKPATVGSDLYAAGSACPSSQVITQPTFVIRPGKLTSTNESKGTLEHNSDVIRGMEGAALLNRAGEIIGVQGGQRRSDSDYSDPRLLGAGISVNRIMGFTQSLAIKAGESIATSSNILPTFDELFLSAYLKSHLSQSNYPSALEDINRAIEKNPNSWESYKIRAYIRERMQDLPRALFDYSKALEINPKDVDTYVKRAELRSQKILDYLGAISDYDQIIKFRPNDSDSYYHRAEIKEQHLDDLSGAKQDYDQVISILSGDPSKENNRYYFSSAYERRAFLSIQLNNIDKAISDYSILISSSSYFNLNDSFRRGDLLHAIGREKQSLEDFKAIANALKAVMPHKNDTNINTNFFFKKACAGIVEMKEGDKKLALKEITTALTILKEVEDNNRISRSRQAISPGSIAVSLDLSMIASFYRYKGIANRLNGNRNQMIADWKEARSLYKEHKNTFGYNLIQKMLKEAGA